MNNIHPFDEVFLQSKLELHRLVFHKFLDNEKYDFCSIVLNYLTESELRAKLDVGNPLAMNTGGYGPIYSVNYSHCEKRTADSIIPSLPVVHWMADVYCTVQWMYNIPSKEIAKRLPPEILAGLYDAHYQKPIKSVCRDLYNEYLRDIIPFHKMKEEKEEEDEICKE